MMDDERRILLTITDDEGQTVWVGPLSDFARENAADPEIVEDARCLACGFGFTVGGGAMPVFKITRFN